MNESLSVASTELAEAYTSDEKMTELLQLKQELIAANSKIALQEQELAQSRVIKHTLDQALGPPSEADFGGRDVTDQTISHLQNAFNASNPAFGQFQDAWSTQDDSQSDISDALSAGTYNRARGIWHQGSQPAFSVANSELPFEKTYGDSQHAASPAGQFTTQPWSGSTACSFNTHVALQPQRTLSGPSASMYGFYSRPTGDQHRYSQAPLQVQNPVPRRSFAQANHAATLFPPPANSWSSFTSESIGESTPKSPTSSTTRSSSAFQSVGIYPIAYHARQAGTALSPTATEFTAGSPEVNSWALSSVSILFVSKR